MDKIQHKREEQFETSSDNIPHVIKVNNTRRVGHVMLRAAVASGHGSGWSQVYLTPDEADQLATMLQLSAADIRAAEPQS